MNDHENNVWQRTNLSVNLEGIQLRISDTRCLQSSVVEERVFTLENLESQSLANTSPFMVSSPGPTGSKELGHQIVGAVLHERTTKLVSHAVAVMTDTR